MKPVKNTISILLILSLGTFSITFGKGNQQSHKTVTPAKTTSGVIWAKHVQQGFNLKIWLSNQMAMGMQAWDPYLPPLNGCSSVQGIGMEYPAGACIEHLYGGGPMIGGIIDSVVRVSMAYNGDDASKEFLPEKQDTSRDKIWRTNTGMDTNHPDGDGYSGYYYNHSIQVNRRGVDDDGDGKIDEDELDGQDNDGDWNPLTDDIGADGLPDSLEVSCNGKRYDPVTNPDPAYDNYDPTTFDSCHPVAGIYPTKSDKNRYTQNNGIPDHGEPHVDEDYGAVSDNDIYLAATDTFKSTTVPGHFPMGIKIFQKTYAWQDSSLNSFIPMDYYFVNIGRNIIKNVYVGFYFDFDVGPLSVADYYDHNYSCYSPGVRCAYTDNPVDPGSTPVGLVLLGTCRSLDSLQLNCSFNAQQFGTRDSLLYEMMSLSGGYIEPCQSPLNPTDASIWLSLGPFGTMNPGDSLSISIALVSGTNVTDMLNNAQRVHDLYGNNYILGVKEDQKPVPTAFRLEQNYPNPFNPSTTIIFDLPRQSVVTLKVYNILGQEVTTIVHNEMMQVGRHRRVFDATGLSSGVYFYKLTAGNIIQTKKMIILR